MNSICGLISRQNNQLAEMFHLTLALLNAGACCSSRGVGSSSTSTFILIIMLPRRSHDLIRNFLSKDVCFFNQSCALVNSVHVVCLTSLCQPINNTQYVFSHDICLCTVAPLFMQFCKGDAAKILYMDVRSVVQQHSGVFVDPRVLQATRLNTTRKQASSHVECFPKTLFVLS